MAVKFPDNISPRYGIRIRFTYPPRAIQYLEWFKIVTCYPIPKFLPLNIEFEACNDLEQFLINRGVFCDEISYNDFNHQIEETVRIVDTIKIYEVEEDTTKYLLNYKYYSVNEVAEMLSFSRPTIYKLINDQALRTTRIHGQLRIRHLDLIGFINKENTQQ